METVKDEKHTCRFMVFHEKGACLSISGKPDVKSVWLLNYYQGYIATPLLSEVMFCVSNVCFHFDSF